MASRLWGKKGENEDQYRRGVFEMPRASRPQLTWSNTALDTLLDR